MTKAQVTAVLRNLGFRIRNDREYRQAVRDFQAGWNLGPALTPDGVVGRLTTAALKTSEARRRVGKGTMSANFSYVQFRCKCGGRFTACRRIWYTRKQVRALEAYRKRVGGPISIVSGYRCPGHNRAVGGASNSQHMYGLATDFLRQLTVEQVKALRVFTGIGFKIINGRALVQHGDTRPGSVTSPTIWRY